MSDAPEIVNPCAGPDWMPVEFSARVDDDEDPFRRWVGFGRGLFAIVCREANGEEPLQVGDLILHVSVCHLPTGANIVSAKHGADAYEIADVLTTFPEFGLPLDVEALGARGPEIKAATEAKGGVWA